MITRFNFDEGAPSRVGNYSHAVKAGNFLFLAGQGPEDPDSKIIFKDSCIKEQTHITLGNIQNILRRFNLGFSDIVHMEVFTTRIDQWDDINEICGSYFEKDKYPARHVIGVSGLAKDIDIEISVIALMNDSQNISVE